MDFDILALFLDNCVNVAEAQNYLTFIEKRRENPDKQRLKIMHAGVVVNHAIAAHILVAVSQSVLYARNGNRLSQRLAVLLDDVFFDISIPCLIVRTTLNALVFLDDNAVTFNRGRGIVCKVKQHNVRIILAERSRNRHLVSQLFVGFFGSGKRFFNPLLLSNLQLFLLIDILETDGKFVSLVVRLDNLTLEIAYLSVTENAIAERVGCLALKELLDARNRADFIEEPAVVLVDVVLNVHLYVKLIIADSKFLPIAGFYRPVHTIAHRFFCVHIDGVNVLIRHRKRLNKVGLRFTALLVGGDIAKTEN